METRPAQGAPHALLAVVHIVVLIYVALGITYVVNIPLWEAPDEPAHFLYALSLAETGELPAPPPPQTASFYLNGYVTSSYEWHQAPPYYALAAGIVRLNRALDLVPAFSGFPPVNPAFPNAYRVFAPAPDRFSLTEAHLVRLLSVVLGALVVFTVGQTARVAFPGAPWLPVLAAGLVAFIPQFTFLHAYITNDSLANLAGALGLLTLARVIRAPQTERRRAWLWAGLAASLALVVKMTAWFVLPLALLLALDLRRRDLRTWTQTGGDLATYGAALLVAPLLTGLLWPDFGARLLAAPHTGGIRADHLSLAHLRGLAPLTHSSFWGRFGWVNVAIPAPLYWLLNALWAVGLVGTLTRLWRNRAALNAATMQVVWLCLWAWGFVFILFIGFNLTVMQPQGRFFYPALAAPVLLVAWGWLEWIRRHRGLGVVVLLAALVGINISALVAGLINLY